MKDAGDGWDDLMARMEVASIETSALRAAAEDLEQAEDTPLPAALVRTMVVEARQASSSSGSRWRRWFGRLRLGHAAGLVLVSLSLTATVVWTSRRFSRSTLDYPAAVEMLRRTDQPAGLYASAVGVAYRRVQAAIEALGQVLRVDGDATVVQGASLGLARLRAAVDGTDPVATDVEVAEIAPWIALLTPDTPSAGRQHAIERIVAQAAGGIRAIRGFVPQDESASAARRIAMSRIASLLDG